MSRSWHALTPEEALAAVEGSPAGLDEAEAARRLRRDGPNRLRPRRGPSALRHLAAQFVDPLIALLVVAAVVSFLLGEEVDAAVIGAVVVVNALIGFFQERRAESAIAALDALVVALATVRRGGEERRLPGEQLVVGDLVTLRSGDAVPADLYLLAARDLQVEEAALTGESVPVRKTPGRLPADTALGDRTNLAFAGTAVTYGQAQGVVVAVGDATEAGRIAGMLAAVPEMTTPLTRRLAGLSRLLVWVVLGTAALMFALEVARGRALGDTFSAAVAFAVGAVPEGLPAAVTIVLAVGVSQMARRGAIVRRLPAVETLGSTTVICSDKTGTLTENQMTVTRVWTAGERFEVSGVGYAPSGGFSAGGAVVAPERHPALVECARCGALCQDTRVRRDAAGVATVEGDPTEAALVVLGEKAGLGPEALAAWPRLDELPFESEHMYMATLHRSGERPVLYVKGSTDVLLARSVDALGPGGERAPLDAAAIQGEVAALAARGLRVLGLARRALPAERTRVEHEDVRELTFLGVVGMIDPARPAARHAIETCRRAGVAVKMITGDHAITAAAIAAELGLEGAREPDGRLTAVAGRDLASLEAEALGETAERVAVFARVAPDQKLALVEALQRRGHVVAMTGDGVNDAPALEQADIGVAMGKGGTDVARGAAAMVLTDDDFATIEAAVEEGRRVYDNLVKFVAWALPTNGGEGLVILAAVVAGATLPILPVQILWVNMATSVLLGTTLVFEPKEPGVMDRPPRPVEAPLLERWVLARVALVSVLIAAAAFGLFEASLRHAPERVDEARTIAANTVVVLEVAYLFACRSLTHPVWRIGLFSNRWLWAGASIMLLVQLAWTYLPVMNRLFHTAPLHWAWWLAFSAAGALVFGAVELFKCAFARR